MKHFKKWRENIISAIFTCLLIARKSILLKYYSKTSKELSRIKSIELARINNLVT